MGLAGGDGCSEMDVRRYELRWTHHQATVVSEVGSLYRDSALVDVTLACEDQRTYQAHKLVLSACSQYFQGLFARHSSHQHPIIFLKDVSGDECEALLTYMYRGEVSVNHEQIQSILRVANSLQVRGLADFEAPSSRPSSPAGDRAGHCPSSSPSPSTGPPTKCPTPISESHSPNPPPPLVNPQLTSLGTPGVPPRLPHHTPHDTPSRHPGGGGGGGPPQPAPHPGLHPDYPYHLLHRPYDLSTTASLLGDGDWKRNDESAKVSPLSSSYMPPLRVKPDLGGNSFDPPGDLGGVSPLTLTDSPRPPYLTQNIFSSLFAHDTPGGAGSQYGVGRMFPISDPLRRLTSGGGETRIHKCQYCSRKFKRKDHLKTHIRIHTGERPYKCKICGRGFIQSQQVKIHMKVHVREDASGVGPPGLGGGGGGSLSSLYHDLGGNYQDQQPGGHPEDSHTDLEQPSEPSQPPDPDSDNDCSSEMVDTDFDARSSQQEGVGGGGGGGGGGAGGGGAGGGGGTGGGGGGGGGGGVGGGGRPASGPPLGSHAGGPPPDRSPPSPGSALRAPLPPPDSQSCSAMSLKESYHIGSNIKK